MIELGPDFGFVTLAGAGRGRHTSFALERGSVIHRLLQVLPSIEVPFRDAAMRRYLASAAAAWPEPEREAVCRSVLAVLEDKTFAPLFSPESRPEVSVMGTLDHRRNFTRHRRHHRPACRNARTRPDPRL